MSQVAPRSHTTGHGDRIASSGAGHDEPQKARMRENFLFLGKFLKHGTRIASVWP